VAQRNGDATLQCSLGYAHDFVVIAVVVRHDAYHTPPINARINTSVRLRTAKNTPDKKSAAVVCTKTPLLRAN
jgi:hypothetical protein